MDRNNDLSAEDPRKKRDSGQVEDKEEEKSKKVRVHSSTRSPSPARRVLARETQATKRAVETIPQPSSNATSPDSPTPARVWDLESALLYLVQGKRDDDEREYLTKHNQQWITFQVGHAGDASTIAHWYRQSISSESPELEVTHETQLLAGEAAEDSPTSMLEVWLADGLGDEDTPPSVHALLAYVHQLTDGEGSEKTTSLGAVALMTLAWTDSERMIRVEWMHTDPSLDSDAGTTLSQRVWLRLSTLACMTASSVEVDEKWTLSAGQQRSINERVAAAPSAE